MDDLEKQNKDLEQHLENANKTILTLNNSQKMLVKENDQLKSENKALKTELLAKTKMNEIIFTQKMVRGFLARKDYKKERDSLTKQIKQGIADALSKDNFNLVTELSNLLNGKKLHQAMQILNSQKQDATPTTKTIS